MLFYLFICTHYLFICMYIYITSWPFHLFFILRCKHIANNKNQLFLFKWGLTSSTILPPRNALQFWGEILWKNSWFFSPIHIHIHVSEYFLSTYVYYVYLYTCLCIGAATTGTPPPQPPPTNTLVVNARTRASTHAHTHRPDRRPLNKQKKTDMGLKKVNADRCLRPMMQCPFHWTQKIRV